MSSVPCEQNPYLRRLIEDYAETLKVEAHLLGKHGLDEDEFYQSGLFRGAIERIRGQFSATMGPKREFVATILNHLEDSGWIAEWHSAGGENRHDYSVTLNDGRISVIELKGCLDGNNTNIFQRPPHADEFVLWSVCSNAGADPRHNVWSGIHTRLSAEIIDRAERVDGLIVWDWICGTVARPCPKLRLDDDRLMHLGPYRLPPPCIYLFPSTVPSPRNNPKPQPQRLGGVLEVFQQAFGGWEEELHEVTFEVSYRGAEIVRTTEIDRDGRVQRKSEPTPIRRA
jgi:hypothetical protein